MPLCSAFVVPTWACADAYYNVQGSFDRSSNEGRLGAVSSGLYDLSSDVETFQMVQWSIQHTLPVRFFITQWIPE